MLKDRVMSVMEMRHFLLRVKDTNSNVGIKSPIWSNKNPYGAASNDKQIKGPVRSLKSSFVFREFLRDISVIKKISEMQTEINK